MAVATFTKSGTKATTPAKLDKSIFGVEKTNHDLLKTAYLAYLANGRVNLAKSKTRGEVSGGGKKPWRQKGTGRARVGSSRTPLWVGGGIIFGPTGNENYSITLTKASKRQAVRQALSMAAKEERIIVLETFECKEGKVSTTIKLFDKIGATGKVLLVVSQKDELVNRATNNLPKVKAINAKYLTVYDLLNADHVVISAKSLDLINEWLGDNK